MILTRSFNLQPSDREILFDVSAGTRWTAAVLHDRAERVSAYVTRHVSSASPRIVVLLPNAVDYVAVLLALFDSGATIIPLNSRINDSKCSYLVRHAQAQLLITSAALLAQAPWIARLSCRVCTLEEIYASSSPGAARSAGATRPGSVNQQFLMYTSGTTGNPKGVMLSRGAVESRIAGLAEALAFTPGDTFFSFLPFSSGHGLLPGLLVPLFSGCRICVAEFSPFLIPRFWQIVEEQSVAYFTSVPSVLQLLKDHSALPRLKPAALKDIFCASAPLAPSLLDWYYRAWGVTVRNCYGLTETASWIAVSAHRSGPGEAQHVGKPCNADILVVNADGAPCLPGERGEILVRSPGNFSGYWDNAAESNAVMKDGFLKTGDLGSRDDDGNLSLLGRIKHIIIRNGINIIPQEVEQVFLEHPDVSECACFGVPDERYGERLVAVLVLRTADAGAAPFLDFARSALPPYLVPDDLVIKNSLPKGETGKVLINTLRGEYRPGR